MVIKMKKLVTVALGGLLVLLGVLFFLYGIFGMNGDENIGAKKTDAEVQEVEEQADGIDPSKPMVALTYDDGPYSPVTGRILESLKSVGGKATFFIVGSRVEGREEVTKKIVEYGSEIGNHTFSHIVLTNTSNENAVAELKKSDETIYNLTGVHTKLVRPPCGCYNAYIKQEIGCPMVLWTVDTKDWSHQNKDKTINYVLSNVKDGDIVLMHDLFVPTAEASEVIIPELAARGYQLVTVSELIKYREEPKGVVLNYG